MFQLRSGGSCFIGKLFNVYQSFLFLEFRNDPILLYQFHLSVKIGLLHSHRPPHQFFYLGCFIFFCLVKREVTGQYISEWTREGLDIDLSPFDPSFLNSWSVRGINLTSKNTKSAQVKRILHGRCSFSNRAFTDK